MKKSETFLHLNRQIPPEAHTPMYNFHKYWSRKTWNVVGKFIENYCPKDGIVFDPFGGSGVTAIEALKQKKKVIISDLNPIATEITRLTIKNINEHDIIKTYEQIDKAVGEKIRELYLTECRKCGTKFPFSASIWTQKRKNNLENVVRECIDIRYKACPKCGDRQSGNNKPNHFDLSILNNIEKQKITFWYPSYKLYHTNGNPFKKKEKFETTEEFYTKRNLYALAILMDQIERITKKDLKDLFKLAFTSMVHLCSALLPEGREGYRPYSGVGWNQQSFWFSPEFMESNVWEKFESAIWGSQGIIRAKNESNRYFKDIKFGKKFEDVIEGTADIFIYNGDCLYLMQKLNKKYNLGCVDYIFTDPPYDESVQYGELSFIWSSWLKNGEKYLQDIESNEIINNEKQNKNFNVYNSLLHNSFQEMFSVLKSDKYLTITFHNPTFKVRNATIRSSVLSGFELQKIHHQELARPSAKSLLQPFGSAQGDFYLRFYKAPIEGLKSESSLIDELRFEKIILNTTTAILAERGEPTPYTIIINAIDPELAKNGFFTELDSGLDVEQILKNHLDKEFILIDGKIGGSSGKLWWFSNPKIVPHLEKTPLSERVEQTVLRQLQSKGKVTFTDIWEAVSIAFPNSLTSDQSSIKNSLEDYARPVNGGFWMIKPNFKPGIVEKEHTTIIALLAEIGNKLGYKIYIGKVEQSHIIESDQVKHKDSPLKSYMDFFDAKKIKNIINPDIVDDIDLLWINKFNIEFMFEVESTTSMTSALLRGSNLDPAVNKIMLFPKDRIKQFDRKMKAPLFHERFENDNWKFILFETLLNNWKKIKNVEDLNILFELSGIEIKSPQKEDDQLLLL